MADVSERNMKDDKEDDRREKRPPAKPIIAKPAPVVAEDYRNPVRKVVESPPGLDEIDLHVGGKQVEREADSLFDKEERGTDPKAQSAAVVVNKFWHHGKLHRKGEAVLLTEEELARARNHVDVTRASTPPVRERQARDVEVSMPPARHIDTDNPSAKTKDR